MLHIGNLWAPDVGREFCGDSVWATGVSKSNFDNQISFDLSWREVDFLVVHCAPYLGAHNVSEAEEILTSGLEGIWKKEGQVHQDLPKIPGPLTPQGAVQLS